MPAAGEVQAAASAGGSGRGAPTAAPRSASTADPTRDDADQPALVVTQTVARTPWVESLELTAELAPWAAVTVAAEVAGRVVALPVDHGDRVAAGAVIARLDTATVAAELAQAEARLASARAALVQAQRDLERGKSLADDILSADAVDQLALAVDTGEAQVAEAAAAVRVVGERLDDLVVRAPFAGVIGERLVEVGSWLAPGTPVMRVVDSSRLKARAAASAHERVRLASGLSVRFVHDAVADAASGSVRFLGEETDERTGTYPVEAVIEPGPGLLPGMSGVLTVELARHEDLLLPVTAVLHRAGDSVFVVEPAPGGGLVARERPVTFASASGQQVRVLSGVADGERVVVQGQYSLRDGQPVEVREGSQGGEPPAGEPTAGQLEGRS